jgi:hypothetical protein
MMLIVNVNEILTTVGCIINDNSLTPPFILPILSRVKATPLFKIKNNKMSLNFTKDIR